MDFVVDYFWVIGLIGIAAIVGAHLFNQYLLKQNNPDPDTVKAQFVVVTTGCMGLLVLMSIIFGIIASLVSIFCGLYKLFH